jgi:lysophospholipase L1-like esterase
VIIAPYEYQLRAGGKGLMDGRDIRLPQQLISEFLAERTIPHVDAATVFTTDAGQGGASYFLAFDPMHFSPAGHAAVFSLVQERMLAGSN